MPQKKVDMSVFFDRQLGTNDRAEELYSEIDAKKFEIPLEAVSQLSDVRTKRLTFAE